MSSYDPQSHLSWGDVAVDNPVSPSCVRVHLRHSKCDPIGRGVDVYFGPVNGWLCPVRALLSYVAGRGDRPGPFFIHPDATPLTKTHFVGAVRLALRQAGLEPRDYAGYSFSHWHCHYGGGGWPGGLTHPVPGPLVERRFFGICPDDHRATLHHFGNSGPHHCPPPPP